MEFESILAQALAAYPLPVVQMPESVLARSTPELSDKGWERVLAAVLEDVVIDLR